MGDWLADIEAEARADARRLLEISPWFARLVRGLSASELRALFQPLGQAILPEVTARWLPEPAADIEASQRRLRRAKRRALAHVIWWELGLHGDIAASWTALSDLADGLIARALAAAELALASRFGRMDGARFAVMGLGKLGGRELNLGSDVDLMFIHDAPPGWTSAGGRQSLPANAYFGRLARMLIRLLDEPTADGRVWPVDMRLRPGGDAAPVTSSLEAAVDFYREHGQTWERAMLLKARCVAGDRGLGAAFLAGIEPFVFRRYLDYTTVTALADMKRRIDAQAGQREVGPGFDVKRGAGGIREIEFIVQAMQLLHGGRHPELRVAGTMAALAALRDFGVLDEEDGKSLAAAYSFWRRVEHAVQARQGEQTHRLPEDAEAYLERALGNKPGLARPMAAMRAHAARVRRLFAREFMPDGRSEAPGAVDWLAGDAPLPDAWSPGEQARARRALERIRSQLARGLLPERCDAAIRRFLDEAVPRWAADANGLAALDGLADLLAAIGGRAAFVDLITAHAGTREWLIGVLAASAWVRERLLRDLSLLEWPLQASRGADDIAAVVRELDALRPGDDERALADLGRLVDRGRLIAALCVDAHEADPLAIGGWLADVADAATRAALRLSLHRLGLPADFPMVALAMGKHGSREMGIDSDLDMVFVLVCEDAAVNVAGRPMREQAQRLGRRMIRILSERPPWGAGYEFDARLRPSGHAGVLVTTLPAFEEYQRGQAQTWEHQALVRARACAGPEVARQAVDGAVRRILDMPRDAGRLAVDVRAMRRKMLAHLSSKRADIINLKQDAGGLVDIEFLAQYARLAFGGMDGGGGRGVCEILNGLPASAPVIWREAAAWLAEAWLEYRWMEHVLTVELARSVAALPDDDRAVEWESLRRHARGSDSPRQPRALREMMARVHDCFERLTEPGEAGKT